MVENSPQSLLKQYIFPGNHRASDYFAAVKACITQRDTFDVGHKEYVRWQNEIEKIYILVADEIATNIHQPVSEVKFGTSGWRGIIGKDLFLKSVSQVTLAILSLYEQLRTDERLAPYLGVGSKAEAKKRGCVLGFDNRFGNELLARRILEILTGKGFAVFYAGESTTGTLSAAVLERKAAFSINLTPSHNPLEYGGIKFNAADAGPAAQILTDRITENAREIIKSGQLPETTAQLNLVTNINALDSWKALVVRNKARHGIDYNEILKTLSSRDDCRIVIDSVHGASRMDVKSLMGEAALKNITFLRIDRDPTFGGIAPEPSGKNFQLAHQELAKQDLPYKLAVIMDPDADRIRFTDGKADINMNQFGAMAYHFIHEIKKKSGMVAKTVATSNFANAIAHALHEDVFEPKVGFKEFKPVIEQALVCFEESDGITVIGHTPEKDAYIGLFLAIDMTLTLKMNLSEYLARLQEEYGHYYPDKDGVPVSRKGSELLAALAQLDQYTPGMNIPLGKIEKKIAKVIDIDGHKMIFEDNSWLMIRPSGTEPKVRFYVEARSNEEKEALFEAAKSMLHKIGLM
jgi:phosphomannomutase